MYIFKRVNDSEIIKAWHKTDADFDKFDISKSNGSVKSGIGFNFTINAPMENDQKFAYLCKIELDNPMSTAKSTISEDKWQKLQEAIGWTGPQIYDLNESDITNYKTICPYITDRVSFLENVRNILGVDGYIDKENDLVVSFDPDKIKIIEKKKV